MARAQRLVLKISPGRTVTVGDFMNYMKAMTELNIPYSNEIEVVDQPDGTQFYYAPLQQRRRTRAVNGQPLNGQEKAIQRASDVRAFREDIAHMMNGSAPRKRVVRVSKSVMRRVVWGDNT